MSDRMRIYMADLVHNFQQGNYVVPLNIGNIAAYLHSIYGTEIDISLFKYPADLLTAIDSKAPDILAFSNYFWNNNLNYQIGKYVRDHYKDVIISMGGPSIRTDKLGIKGFLERNSFVDAYIMFEGERPFANLIKEIRNDKKRYKDGKIINGCAYLIGSNLAYEPLLPLEDLAQYPSPYLSGLMDEFLHIGLWPLFETNRGCPFSCTFCTWGISALHKLRPFPTARVFNEMEFVSKNFPDIAVWMFADANFGILNRDLEIAQRIKEIKEKTPALKRVVLWQTKNKSKENMQIGVLIGDLERYLIAVQTFDPTVQKLIKRENIIFDDMPSLVSKLKQSGIKISTDILCGLPGETKESHLDTLRKCFDAGFDLIDCGNVLLLKGSEMETEESRRRFEFITKFRLRQGCYGEYDGIRAMDYEEIIWGSKNIKENEMLEIRLIHWFICYGWNAGFLRCVMSYLHRQYKINPVDLIAALIASDDAFLKDFCSDFVHEADNELFESEQALISYYQKTENWDHLLHDHFPKMNFKYTALLILDAKKFFNFMDSISKIIIKATSSAILYDVMNVIKNTYISPEAIYNGEVVRQKKVRVNKNCLGILLEDNENSVINNGLNCCDIDLEMDSNDIVSLQNLLKKYKFNENKTLAVEKTLETFVDKFNYKIRGKEIKHDDAEMCGRRLR